MAKDDDVWFAFKWTDSGGKTWGAVQPLKELNRMAKQVRVFAIRMLK